MRSNLAAHHAKSVMHVEKLAILAAFGFGGNPILIDLDGGKRCSAFSDGCGVRAIGLILAKSGH